MRKVVEGSLADRFLRAIFDPKRIPAAASAAAERVAIAAAAQHGGQWLPFDICDAPRALQVLLEVHPVRGHLRLVGSGRDFGDCDRVAVAWLSEDGEAVLDSELFGNVACPGLGAAIAAAEVERAEAAAQARAEAAAKAAAQARAVEDAKAAAWATQAAAAEERDARAWFRERFENALAALEVEGFVSHAERMVLRTQHAAADAALRHMAPAVAHDYDTKVVAEQVIADLVADWVNGDLQAAKPALS